MLSSSYHLTHVLLAALLAVLLARHAVVHLELHRNTIKCDKTLGCGCQFIYTRVSLLT